MKRIGVIGAGSAGICSLAMACNWLDKSWEVTSVYDPTISITGIGESTNANFVLALEHIGLELNKLEELDGTLKFGTKFVNWGKHEWINPLIEGAVAIHFNTFKLKDFVFTRLKKLHPDKFKILEGNISSVAQTDSTAILTVDDIDYNFDYVIDCRGFPTDYTDYTYSDCSLVNHCLVHVDTATTPEQYTEHRATKNGWMFGVPLTTRTSYGYLYNDTFTTKEAAIEDMANELGIDKQDLSTKEFVFKPYYANKILDGRILKNGNRALFFEPISATSIWMYITIFNLFLRKIVIGDITEERYNMTIRYDLQSVETVIRYFYHGGSIFTTKFWIESKNRAIAQLKKDNQFYKLVNSLNNARQRGTPYEHEGLVFGALSWYKIAENFGHDYFNNPDNFQFEIENTMQNKIKPSNEIVETTEQNMFSQSGYAIVKNILDQETSRLVAQYALFDLAQNYNLTKSGDGQIPGTHFKYADPMMETLLLKFHSAVERATGLELYPTYSYYRVYKPGDTLDKHIDRPSCEVSVTVCIGLDYKDLNDTYHWPIYMNGTPCILNVGDGAIYRGCDVDHWRDKFEVPEGSWQVQAFFHYVDANGPYSELKFDNRPSIGYRQPAQQTNQLPVSNKKYVTFTG